MTIAAGFRCKDGVVLCSDTQISNFSGRSYETKLFPIKIEADCHLVYAGYVEFIKEFVADLKEIAQPLEDHKLIQAIKKHYKQAHKTYFTDAPKSERAFAQIIVTVREGERISLFGASGRSFYPVDNYISFGTGAPTAEPFFAAMDFYQNFTDYAATSAIYALWRIRAFAEGVGGTTKVLSIEDDSIFGPPSHYEWTQFNIQQAENAYAYLDESIRPLYQKLPFLQPSDIVDSCRAIGKKLKKFRTAQLKAAKARK